MVNELFPPIVSDDTDDEDNVEDRSDASRSPDEGITSDDEELLFGPMDGLILATD